MDGWMERKKKKKKSLVGAAGPHLIDTNSKSYSNLRHDASHLIP